MKVSFYVLLILVLQEFGHSHLYYFAQSDVPSLPIPENLIPLKLLLALEWKQNNGRH